MISLDGSRLTFDEFRRVAQLNEAVRIDPDALPAMLHSRAVVERLALGDDPVYAVNTGVGLLADVRVPPGDLDKLQRNVVRSHSAGVGEPLVERQRGVGQRVQQFLLADQLTLDERLDRVQVLRAHRGGPPLRGR